MSSHADLHAKPESELPREIREAIDRVYAAQEAGLTWRGAPPVRYVEVAGNVFVRENAGKGIPRSLWRAAAFGAAGLLTAALGMATDGVVGTGLLVIGALCLLGCVYWLANVSKEREALRDGPTKNGIYLIGDALVLIGEAVHVIHRSEACNARLVPRGAITGVETIAEPAGETTRHTVVMRIRKTTGEIVAQPLAGYATAVRSNPLRRLLEEWLG
jgi:hypothetical protein